MAAGLAACGGGGGDFTAEANEVCRDATRAGLAVYTSPIGAEMSQKDAVAAESRYLENGEQRERELRALEAPGESRSAFEGFLAKVEKGNEVERQAVEAAKKGDKEGFGKLKEEGSKVAKERSKAAAAVPGLDDCAEKMSPAAAREVAETIERNETEANPAQCTEYIMPNLVKAQWKTQKGCREFQEHETAQELPRSVDVEVTEGVDGITATAEVTFHGGQIDGKTIEYGMAFEDGKWKLAYAAPKES